MSKGTYDKQYYDTHKSQCLKNVRKYQAKLSSINIRIKPEVLDRYKDFASSVGMSLRGFILEAIEEKIMNMKAGEWFMSRYDKQYYQEHKKQYNESHKKYRNNNLKRIPLDVSIEWYDHLQEFCKLHDMKINTFIKQACETIATVCGYYDFLDHETQELLRKFDEIDANRTVQMQEEMLVELAGTIHRTELMKLSRKAPNKPNELTDEEKILLAIYGEEELQKRRQEKANLERKE